MTPIKIPDTCKPGLDITLGYSGGMALYVVDWESALKLFNIMAYYEIGLLADFTINYSTIYN